MQCFIAGGCTPLLQVTDTDFAQSFKASVSQAQMELRQQCRQEAKLAGVKPTFSCGAKEILKIIRKAEALQQKRHEVKPWIIAACRRNGWLHWRPDFLNNRLADCRQQKWCEEHPEGSYRLPSRWIEERGMFVDSAGKPLKANYDEFSKAAKLAANAELEYCNEEGFAWKPKCLENKVTLPEEHAVIEFEAEGDDGTKDLASFVDQLPAKQRRRLKLVDLKVDIQSLKAKAASKIDESGKDVKMAKKSAQVLLQKGREMLAEKMKTMSRQEALAAMVCRAGTSLKRKGNLKSKPSAKTKPSLKSKASLKNKASLKK
jgi:hypothetical protein